MVFTELEVNSTANYFRSVLNDNERVVAAYQAKKNYVVFTGYRIMLLGKAFSMDRRSRLISVPYKSITGWECECTDKMKFSNSVVIRVGVQKDPIKIELKGKNGAEIINRLLSSYVIR